MTKENGKLYIAYGSNLNLKQMRHRCPTAKVVGTVSLEGWKMTFRGKGNGVATIEHSENDSVPVLIWRIMSRDEQALDIYEGAPSFYRKETIPVELDGETVQAMVYIMNDGHPLSSPSNGYYATILEGYLDAGFDPAILKRYADATKKEERIMTDTIREQIMAIRDSGETNMLDARMVQVIAKREGYYELVCFIEDHRREYVHFIFTGEES